MPRPVRSIVSSILLLALGATCKSHAEEPDEKIIAAMPRHFPPIYSVSRNNLPTGFGVQFMELVAKYADLDVEYHPEPTWAQTLESLRTNRADLIPNLGITPERQRDFVFSKPYDHVELSIFVRRDNMRIHGRDDLRAAHVGVVQANLAQTLLRQEDGININVYGSLGQLVAALEQQEVDAAVYPANIFSDFTAKLGIRDSVKKVGEPLETVARAIAVRKDRAQLLSKLNRAIDRAIQSPEFKIIYERWHPGPAPFWSASRVGMLIAALLVLFSLFWFLYRMTLIRRHNNQLVSHIKFNDAVLNATSDGIVTLNNKYQVVSINAYAETLFGQGKQALEGRAISTLLPGNEVLQLFDYVVAHEKELSGRSQTNKPSSVLGVAPTYSMEAMGKRHNGELFPVRVGVARFMSDGEYNLVCTVHDESRTQQAELRAEQITNHDPLTGLLNQRGLFNYLDALDLENVPTIHCFCVGLTHLNQVNSLYGRQTGDKALMESGAMLAQTLQTRFDAHVARVSGNRFIITVVNPRVSSHSIAESLRANFNQLEIPSSGHAKPITIDVVIGIAEFPVHAQNMLDLVDHAEIAYIHAKREGYDNLGVYNETVKLAQSEYENAYQRVKSALKGDRLTLYFQPIMNIETGEVRQFEALLRMFDENGNLLMPADIIPIAEKFNLINQIDYKVLRLGLAKLASIKKIRPDIGISVNLSAAHLGDSKLYELLRTDMSQHDIDSANLVFEITESVALQNFSAAREFMNGLKRFGCRFALDDFGVGFTSFAQLRALPVDIIKIDGIFIRELHNNTQDQVFVKAMTEVAHSLGKKVIAEFVENDEILRYLKKYKVDYAQGYFIGRPDPELGVLKPATP